MISDLDLHGCNVFQECNVVWLKSVSILEALGRFEIIFLLFVDCAHSVPAEHTLHLALHQAYLWSLKGLVLLSQSQFKQCFHRDSFRMVRMYLQKFLGVLQALLIILRIVKFLRISNKVLLVAWMPEHPFEVNFQPLCWAFLWR